MIKPSVKAQVLGTASYPYPSRKRIQAEMLRFARPQTWRGLLWFAADYSLYIAALAGILFVDPLWAKIGCSLVAGLKIANLVPLAHDAAHGSLVRGRRLNKVLAILAFMPALFNYRLWLLDHHVLHHPKVNGKHRDTFTPFSKAEYDVLPAHRRFLERLYRAPYGLGFGLYYIVERWLGVKFFPRSFMSARVRAEAWPHFALLCGYLLLLVGGLAAAPLYSGTGSVTAVILGFLLPYYIWMMLAGFSLYIQHTHPEIPWFDGPVDRTKLAPPELLSAHIEFPRATKPMMHNLFDHPAHHVQPAIPCYRLAHAQARLNELLGPYAIKTDFSIRWFGDTVRRCKLYDFERHRWLDFAGRPTTGQLLDAPAFNHAAPPHARAS